MISAITGLATVSQAPKVTSPAFRRFFRARLRTDMPAILSLPA